MTIKASLKRVIFLIISIFLMGGALFCYSTLIRPTYSNVTESRAKLTNRKGIVEENKVVIQKTQNLLSQYKNSEQLSSIVSSILPKEPNSSSLVNQITNLAKINGLNVGNITVSLQAIRPSESGQALIKGVGIINVDCRIEGNYENFKTFLQNLETNINLMELTNIKISSVSGKLSYSLGIETYYQVQ